MKEKKTKAKEIIERAHHSGDLLHVATDTDLPMDTRVKAVQMGSFGDLNIMARDTTLPKDVRLVAAKRLAKHVRNESYEDLAELAKDKSFPEDVKEIVINKLIDEAEKVIKHQDVSNPFKYLVRIMEFIKTEALPKDVKMRAKSELEKKAKEFIERGNRDQFIGYNLLKNISFLPKDAILVLISKLREWGYVDKVIKLATDNSLPEDVRKFAKNNLVDTAKKAIEYYAGTGRYFDLLELAKDENLPEDIRQLAKNSLLNAAEKATEPNILYPPSADLFKLADEPNLPEDLRKRAKEKAHEHAFREEESKSGC